MTTTYSRIFTPRPPPLPCVSIVEGVCQSLWIRMSIVNNRYAPASLNTIKRVKSGVWTKQAAIKGFVSLTQDPCSEMGSPWTEKDPALESEGNIVEVSSELEMALKDYIFKLEVGNCSFLKWFCVQACKTFYESSCRLKENLNAGGWSISRRHCCNGHPTCIQ